MVTSLLYILQKIKDKRVKKQNKKIKKEEKKKEKALREEGLSFLDARKQVNKDKDIMDKKTALRAKQLASKLVHLLISLVGVLESILKALVAVLGPYVLCLILIIAIILSLVFTFMPNIGEIGVFDPMTPVEKLDASDETETNVIEDYSESDWKMSDLAIRGVLLTDRQKNFYRLTSLYTKLLAGDYGYKFLDKSVVNVLGQRDKTAYLMGFSAVESAMRFYKKDKQYNILEVPSDIEPNSSGYAFLGLNKNGTLAKYNGGSLGLSSDVIKEIKNTWKPKSTPICEGNYVPYGTAMQGKFIDNTINSVYSGSSKTLVDTELEKSMKAYNIKENKEILKAFVVEFLSAAQYHGAQKAEYTGYISFWCALWAATSTIDANRGFKNITFAKDTDRYDESASREAILSYHYGANGVASVLQLNKGGFNRFAICGKTVNKSIWGYAYDYCGNKEYFNSTAVATHNKVAALSGHGADRVLNFHYGLLAYITGEAIMQNVEKKLLPKPFNFVETPGKGQGVWDGMDIDTFIHSKSKYITVPKGIASSMLFKDYWGTSWCIREGEKNSSYIWAKNSKWKVPFYGQSMGKDVYPIFLGGHLNFGKTSKNLNGCGYYMTAYMASALTGKMINPAELASAAFVTGSMDYVGGYFFNDVGKQDKMNNTFQAINCTFMQFSDSKTDAQLKKVIETFKLKDVSGGSNYWKDYWKYIDQVLAKGGIIGVSMAPKTVFTSGGHYMCITEKVGTQYRVYTSSYISQLTMLFDRSAFEKRRDGDFYFAIANKNIN